MTRRDILPSMICTLALLALGAVSGTPEPQPGDNGEDGVLVTLGNDAFGFVGGNPDDNRTNQITAWARWDNVQLIVDDSMLTNRAAGTRTDEWTVTLGYQFSPELTVGAGYRWRGNSAGSNLQNQVHEWIGQRAVHLNYDRETETPVGYAVYTKREYQGPFGYESITAALVSLDGDLAVDQVARGVVRWRWVHVWAGTRYQIRESSDIVGYTRQSVDAYERGLWIETGLRIGYTSFATSYSPEHEEAVGAFGVFVSF